MLLQHYLLLPLFASLQISLPPSAASEPVSSPKHTVFWISVDGLRPDYLDRADTPFFDRLRAKGAYSNEVWPVFPSVTFSSHVSQATGVKPERHGIPGNSFYDNKERRIHRYPGDGSLLETEPIWITASRQDVRTAVLDWPLAHNQQGPVTSAHFAEFFERGIGDEHRLNRLLDRWEEDRSPHPLRLILGYVISPDREGHQFGPDSFEVTKAVERIDSILARGYARAKTLWKLGNPGEDDRLFLIVSSDHGMSAVHTLVHPGNLTGLEGRDDLLIITTGNVAHVHLNRIRNKNEREALIDQTLARLSEFDYVRAYRREEIPEEWGMRHPRRTGDIFLVLDNGYTFNRRAADIEQAVEEVGGPLGMHGYDPVGNPEMLTPLFIYRSGDPIGGGEIGPVHSLQLHAMVCRILGIEPAPEAMKDVVVWESTPAEVGR